MDAFFESLPSKSPKKSASTPKKSDGLDASEFVGTPDVTVSPLGISEPCDDQRGSDALPLPEKSQKDPNVTPSSPAPAPVKRGRGRPKKEPMETPSGTPKDSEEPKKPKDKELKERKEAKEKKEAKEPREKKEHKEKKEPKEFKEKKERKESKETKPRKRKLLNEEDSDNKKVLRFLIFSRRQISLV